MNSEELFLKLLDIGARTTLIQPMPFTMLRVSIPPQEYRVSKISQLVFDFDLTEGFIRPNTDANIFVPLDKYPDIKNLFEAYNQLSPNK